MAKRFKDLSHDLDVSPVEVRSISPSRAFVKTQRNGRQLLFTSDIVFDNGTESYALVVEKSRKKGGLVNDVRIQTLDFSDVVINYDKADAELKGLEAYVTASPFLSKDNKWMLSDFDGSEIKRGALDTHFGAERALRYYFDEFARNGVDDDGMVLLNAIAPQQIRKAVLEDGHNAFWAGSFNYKGVDYGMMAYLDGVGRDRSTGRRNGKDIGLISGLDVLGHEITHGVTQNTADLEYVNESGALNEGFSDIFGTNVKVSVEGFDPAGGSWVIGSGWWPIRNMANPNQYLNADTYNGEYWVPDADPTDEIQSLIVHSNSGVLNFWYALLVEGSGNMGPGRESPDLLIGSQENYTNDNGYVYAVNGIGVDKAQGVAYRALVEYLAPNSDFLDAREATIQAANDLTRKKVAKFYPGVPRLTSSDVESVVAAWDAVGVGGGLGPVADFTLLA